MNKTTFGFTVETDHDSILIKKDNDNQTVAITPHEVDLLISMLQEAKAEFLEKK